MNKDPIVQAVGAQDALERFAEVTGCLQYGEGWSCTQPATPDGPQQVSGHDDRGNEVWMRRYRCVAGHWYHVETPAPDAGEVDGLNAQVILRVSRFGSR